MKVRQVNNYSQSLDSDSFQVNTSDIVLEYGKPRTIYLPPLKPLPEDLNDEQRRLFNEKKHDGLDPAYKDNYQPAKFSKALEYRNARSYMKKLPSGEYEELQLLASTENLKYFGLGAYFYIEFLRRVTWLFFVLSLLVVFTIAINWQGSGMNSYASSLSTYLIKSTMGNYSANRVTPVDGYIVTVVPFASFLAMFVFYLIWKGHYAKISSQAEKDKDDIKPEKFCIEIEGLEGTDVTEEELGKFFSAFGPVYQVSLIKRYKNKLAYFEQLDELEGEIKEGELQAILGGGDKEKLVKLKAKKEELLLYINKLQIVPKTTGAFVHFQFEKSKADCLEYLNQNYLFSNCSHGIARNCLCCCVGEPDQRYLFKGTKLLANSEKVPAPEDINWLTFDISLTSRFFRGLFAFFVILIFLGVSCAIIGLCSIYIASHASNCQDVVVPTSVAAAAASTDSTAVQCYCDANLVAALSDSAVKAVCQSYLTNIYVSQVIQYAVIFTSSLTNFLFGLIVDKLINFLRPISKSSGLLAKTTILTIFLIFNTILIPLLIYSDIFGFQPSNYVSFVTIISSDVKNFFQVSNISFYPNFSTVWYRNVSVIYINYLIVNTVVVWLFFLKDKCTTGRAGLQELEGKILQKSMNAEMTSYRLDVFQEAANFYMVMVMCGLFCAGVPVLVPLAYINLLSRYITNRSLLQENSARINGLGEEFASFTRAILPLMLVVCPLVGEWMLVAHSDIYPSALAMSFPYLGGLVMQLDRQLYLPFYLLLSLLVFCEFFLHNTFVRFGSFLCGLCYERKEVVQAYHTRPFSEYARGINILCSYNIKNNDEIRNAVANMQKYVCVEVPNKLESDHHQIL